MTTFTDWTHVGGAWGRAGVVRVFDQLAAVGIRDVYWRVFNGGLAMYPSRAAQPQDDRPYQRKKTGGALPVGGIEYIRETDFRHYDPLPDAIGVGREFGIRVHFWYTIYEEAHGLPFFSPFAEAHPGFWQMDREGRSYPGTIEFGFEEVRQYKLRIIDELLSYRPDGLLLDFARHNATPSAGRDGVHRFGFNPAIREAYRAAHGVDPIDLPASDGNWLAFRREPLTRLVREIRRRTTASLGEAPIGVLTWAVDNPTWTCLDLPTLTAEGSVGFVGGASMAYAFDAGEPVAQFEALRRQVAEGTPVRPSISAYGRITDGHVAAMARAADAAGIEELILHEADALARERVRLSIRSINSGAIPAEKVIVAPPSEQDDPLRVDWAQAGAAADFVSARDGLPEAASATRVRVVHTPRGLLVRLSLTGDLPPDEPADPDYQQAYKDALGVRSAAHFQHRLGVFISVGRACGDYLMFAVTAHNRRSAARYDGGAWSPGWSSTIDPAGEGEHLLTLDLPYEALGTSRPRAGETWGITVVRGFGPERPMLVWSPTMAPLPTPEELGVVRFG